MWGHNKKYPLTKTASEADQKRVLGGGGDSYSKSKINLEYSVSNMRRENYHIL